MQQVLDYFQSVDDCILRIVLLRFPIAAPAKIIGKIGKESLVEIVKGVDGYFTLSAVRLQTPQAVR